MKMRLLPPSGETQINTYARQLWQREIQIKTELINRYFYLSGGQQLKRLEIHSFDEAVWKQELLHIASDH